MLYKGIGYKFGIFTEFCGALLQFSSNLANFETFHQIQNWKKIYKEFKRNYPRRAIALKLLKNLLRYAWEQMKYNKISETAEHLCGHSVLLQKEQEHKYWDSNVIES